MRRSIRRSNNFSLMLAFYKGITMVAFFSHSVEFDRRGQMERNLARLKLKHCAANYRKFAFVLSSMTSQMTYKRYVKLWLF